MALVGKYCELRPDNLLAAGAVSKVEDGYIVKTDVVGTPDKFNGTQTLMAPSSMPVEEQRQADLPSIKPASSENLRATSPQDWAAAHTGQNLLRDAHKNFRHCDRRREG